MLSKAAYSVSNIQFHLILKNYNMLLIIIGDQLLIMVVIIISI